jgi:hypothetical protein
LGFEQEPFPHSSPTIIPNRERFVKANLLIILGIPIQIFYAQ